MLGKKCELELRKGDCNEFTCNFALDERSAFFFISMLCSCIKLAGELQTGVRRLIFNQCYYY